MPGSTLTLVFLKSGVAILEEDDEQTWASDDDEDFEIEIGNEPLTVEDATSIITYLQEHDIINEREAQAMSIEEEGDDVIDADFKVLNTTKAS